MKWKNKSHVPNHQPELVSWDVYFQYILKNNSNVPNHQTGVHCFNHLENMKVNGKDYPIYEMEK